MKFDVVKLWFAVFVSVLTFGLGVEVGFFLAQKPQTAPTPTPYLYMGPNTNQ